MQQVKALNYGKFERFIDGLSFKDLDSLSDKFDSFIELLFLEGLENTEEYTKAIHILIAIQNAMEVLKEVK